MNIADVVYILCAVTSLACAILLGRAYRRSGTRLLLWSCLCFTGLFLNNVLLIVDTSILPNVDLRVLRQIPALLGVALLLYGLIWEGSGR
jgi:hypothetical protein